MSQAPSQPNGRSPSPQRVAVLHRQGDRWRLLVAEFRGVPAVVEARTLPADPASGVAEAAERHGFRRLVVVAPVRATVARCASLPAGPAEAMADAAGLMAEAQLPESLPAHRRAAGLIPDLERPGLRTVLITGWAAGEGKAVPPAPAGVEVAWTTPVAALAALRGEFAGALYADPHDGGIVMLAGGAERTLARVLVEDAASGFWRSVAQVASETSAAAGAPALPVPSSGAGPLLRLDPRSLAALRSAARDVPDRAEWLNDYGIALGAAMVALSPDPLVRPLAGMLERAPVVREAAMVRAADWISRPRHAWAVAAAAVGVMLLGPLALGAARLAIVEAKARGMADSTRGREESARRMAMNQQLEASRWPMTKLLADISAAVPLGVVVDTLSISPEQGVMIKGTADVGLVPRGAKDRPEHAAELVNTLQSNLGETRLFTNVKVNRFDSTGSSVKFDVTADVRTPHNPAKRIEDYAATPLAARLYGEGASNTAAPAANGRAAAAREPRRDRPGAESRAEREESRAAAERAERPRDGGSRPAAAPTEPPAALTAEQIEAMTASEATAEWVHRGTFVRKNPTLDAATKARLEDEVVRLKARQRAAQGGGS